MQICKRCTSCSLLWEGREDSSAPGERLLAPGEELSNKEKELATDAAAGDVDCKHGGQGGRMATAVDGHGDPDGKYVTLSMSELQDSSSARASVALSLVFVYLALGVAVSPSTPAGACSRASTLWR